jgi:hypothetical protein
MLCDVIGHMLDCNLDSKQTLLEETNVYARAEMLLRHLSATTGAVVKASDDFIFPPQFSMN